MAVIRKNKLVTVEPIDNPVDGGYTWLLHERCTKCRQYNILQFHGAGVYKCKHCGKEIIIRRER